MSFGSIHLAVHVIAPKIVYYELFWILHLILSKYMRSKSENVISALCKSPHNLLMSKPRCKANMDILGSILDSHPMQEIDTEASCAC